MWFGVSLWLTCSAGLVVPSPRILSTPSLLLRGRVDGGQGPSAVAKTLFYYQHLSYYQCKVQHCKGCCGESKLDSSTCPGSLIFSKDHLLLLLSETEYSSRWSNLLTQPQQGMSWLCLDELEASCLGS